MQTAVRVSRDLEPLLAAAEARFALAHPESRERHARACDRLPAGHSRQTLYFPPFPLTIASGEGAYVTDLDGHRYLNLVGDYAAGVFGASCEPIQRAIREALAQGLSLSGPNVRELELAELISQRLPSIELLRFCNSGSEACLYAAQTARHATRRPKLLVFHGCYHGSFLIFGASDPPLTVPVPVVKARYNDVDGTRAVLRANATDLAAVLVEPMLGAGGCIPGTPEFLAMLREETSRLGIVLVFDEVMTSRLGPGGAQGRLGIRPDLTTLGKFWGGGLSFGAFGGARELMQHFDTREGGQLSQAGTFNNNVLTMSAGLAGARDVYTADACEELNARGDRLREALGAMARRRGVALQATGLGAVMSTHWSGRPIADPSHVDPPATPLRRLFQLELLEQGYYIAQRGMINLSLPVTEADLDGFLRAVDGFLARHARLLPKAAA
jgi:glutamate-1-semialdehyde 2,1-aminomutase